jgi:predicted dehydrogenase
LDIRVGFGGNASMPASPPTPTSDRALRVGLVGEGPVATEHLAAWSRCSGARVVAACGAPSGRVAAGTEGLGPMARYDSADAMLAGEGLDAIDIVTSRETHGDMLLRAAAQGVHVLCERPLCPTLGEAQSLLREVGDTIRVMVNERSRYRADYRRISDWLREDRLGTIVQARIASWRSSLLPGAGGQIASLARQPSLAREERFLIAESLIHELDVARALFGELDVIACTTGKSSSHIAGEDSATIVLRTQYGLTVTIDGVMSAAGHAAGAPNRVEIAGTRCSVILENALLRLVGTEDETHRYDEADVRQRSVDSAVQHFVDQLRGGGPFWSSAHDHLATLRLMEQAYELADSAPSLGPTRLPPIAPPVIGGRVA